MAWKIESRKLKIENEELKMENGTDNSHFQFSTHNSQLKEEVRHMWQSCFHDSEAFLDLYFSEKYADDNTLVYIESGKPVASLQMLPYQFTFYGTDIPISYISGACTLPAFRRRGYMSRLLEASFEVMRRLGIPLSILVPAEAWLFDYYAQLGYEQVFDAGGAEIPLKEILDQANGDISLAYQTFNRLFERKDFCIRKTEADFRTIVKDAQLENFPPKTNLAGMARIIDAERLISLADLADVDLQSVPVDNINLLCRLLFGYHLEQLPKKLTRGFEPHEAVLNLMLE